MGSYSLQSASYIVGRLGVSTPMVEAACTYSSVATGPVGIRVAGAGLPAVFVGLVIGRKWWRLREPGLFRRLPSSSVRTQFLVLRRGPRAMHAPLTLFELALALRRDKFGNDVRADPRSRADWKPNEGARG